MTEWYFYTQNSGKEAVKIMKVKVLVRFNDKFTKERREEGKVYEYSTERAKELEKNGYVEILKEEKKGV